MQIPLTVMELSECPEDGPDFLHVLSMFLFRDPIRIDAHSKCEHHRLQAALRAESVQLIGIRPTSVREEHFRVVPVPAMSIGEI